MSTTPSEYASFLVRLWREGNAGAHSEATSGWQGEIEHIQSGQRWVLSTLDETLSCLRRQADNLEGLNLPVNE